MKLPIIVIIIVIVIVIYYTCSCSRSENYITDKTSGITGATRSNLNDKTGTVVVPLNEKIGTVVAPLQDNIKCKDSKLCHTHCKGTEVCWDNNVNCGKNYKYLESMCLMNKKHDNTRLCNSITNIVPRPQNLSNSPKTFMDF